MVVLGVLKLSIFKIERNLSMPWSLCVVLYSWIYNTWNQMWQQCFTDYKPISHHIFISNLNCFKEYHIVCWFDFLFPKFLILSNVSDETLWLLLQSNTYLYCGNLNRYQVPLQVNLESISTIFTALYQGQTKTYSYWQETAEDT